MESLKWLLLHNNKKKARKTQHGRFSFFFSWNTFCRIFFLLWLTIFNIFTFQTQALGICSLDVTSMSAKCFCPCKKSAAQWPQQNVGFVHFCKTVRLNFYSQCVSYQCFDNNSRVTFRLHVCELRFSSGEGGDGGKQLTNIQYKFHTTASCFSWQNWFFNKMSWLLQAAFVATKPVFSGKIRPFLTLTSWLFLFSVLFTTVMDFKGKDLPLTFSLAHLCAVDNVKQSGALVILCSSAHINLVICAETGQRGSEWWLIYRPRH